MKKTKLEFRSHTANLASVRKQVRQFLADSPLSEKQRALIVLGVDEACTNIIRHAYALRDDRPIRLSMEQLRDSVRMRLRDYGEPIYLALKELSSTGPKRGGRGIHFMRQAFDTVQYQYRPRGTELLLTKNLE
jgi:serine/threonine-protein kinase RsbW